MPDTRRMSSMFVPHLSANESFNFKMFVAVTVNMLTYGWVVVTYPNTRINACQWWGPKLLRIRDCCITPHDISGLVNVVMHIKNTLKQKWYRLYFILLFIHQEECTLVERTKSNALTSEGQFLSVNMYVAAYCCAMLKFARINAVNRSAQRRRHPPKILQEEFVQRIRNERIRQAQDKERCVVNLKKYLLGEVSNLSSEETKTWDKGAPD